MLTQKNFVELKNKKQMITANKHAMPVKNPATAISTAAKRAHSVLGRDVKSPPKKAKKGQAITIKLKQGGVVTYPVSIFETMTVDDPVLTIGFRDRNCAAAVVALNAWGAVVGQNLPNWLQTPGRIGPGGINYVRDVHDLKHKIMEHVRVQSGTQGILVGTPPHSIAPNNAAEYANLKVVLSYFNHYPCFRTVNARPLGDVNMVVERPARGALVNVVPANMPLLPGHVLIFA